MNILKSEIVLLQNKVSNLQEELIIKTNESNKLQLDT